MIKHRLAIFASGTGSNAINIIQNFKKFKDIDISFILSNKVDAPIVLSANKLGKKVIVLSNAEVEKAEILIDICEKHTISTIILAGYLRKIPVELIKRYPNKIINIHPSLLPKFGGKGMYGKNVHLEVIKCKEKETGITIHFVNEEYDKGEMIAQFSFPLQENESLQNIQEKIHALEMDHFPEAILKAINY